jgi:hypothetical protein
VGGRVFVEGRCWPACPARCKVELAAFQLAATAAKQACHVGRERPFPLGRAGLFVAAALWAASTATPAAALCSTAWLAFMLAQRTPASSGGSSECLLPASCTSVAQCSCVRLPAVGPPAEEVQGKGFSPWDYPDLHEMLGKEEQRP